MHTRELIGKLTLQENVSPIENNKIQNTFVLHIPNPLATYYTTFSEINNPNSVLFLTKKTVSFEGILRVTKMINEAFELNLDGAKCEIRIGNRKYGGIRVKNINKFSDIEKIQSSYMKEGFEFERNVRINKENEAIIRVNKFFELNKVEDGIYQSPNNEDRYYFVIPKHMTWDQFRDLTFDIKNNVSVTNFDIAKGIFYENDGITDMLRIIKPNISFDMVKEIQQKYLDRLS